MAVSEYALPPEECSMRNDMEEYDLEALIREAYEIMEAQIKADRGFIMESGPRGSEDMEEDASTHRRRGRCGGRKIARR